MAVIGKLKSKEDFGEKEIKLAIDQRTLNMGASRIRRDAVIFSFAGLYVFEKESSRFWRLI